MYTKRKNKSILLLTFINFVLSVILFNVHYVHAEYTDTSEYETINADIISKDDLLGSQLDYVEYETLDGKTISVTKLKAQELEYKKQKMIEEKRERERIIAMKTINTSRSTSVEDINIHTDLSIMNTIDADQMNTIIDYWDSQFSGSIPFKNKGQMFIDAAKQSGLDPVYILAHAGLESGWGAKNMSHNYFGIGAFDSNPSNGHAYGNGSMEEGIINGAKWISKNYYKEGQTTLYTMRHNGGKHEYCTSNTWMHDIANIMTTSYSLIK